MAHGECAAESWTWSGPDTGDNEPRCSIWDRMRRHGFRTAAYVARRTADANMVAVAVASGARERRRRVHACWLRAIVGVSGSIRRGPCESHEVERRPSP
jgi:hypothetical protein